ncbi:hypothetical protein [Cysteiniphilum sp. QT6929]|uniref:hypothetical protein n=1 Tax=Cysteiniphilum sp. QT6929 TaxID=2975055 RepID=UPI0024B325ED|nr:hypothetical protein [Cysteiniphilum sp. QT6929]WHN65290.1 hypothetical protein NYP54_09610 [Cysteiniphilum sp. QT6929]
MRFFARHILSTLSLVVGSMAYAVPFKDCNGGVTVSGMFDYVYENKQNELGLVKRITNSSCKTSYYLISLEKVNRPFAKGSDKAAKNNMPAEEEMTIKDMALSGVLLSPQKMILGPKRKDDVNFIINREIHSADKLSFYRLKFTPVLPEKKYGFDVDEKVAAEATLNLGVSTAIVVEPKNPDYTYDLQIIEGEKVTLQNQGNALIILDISGKCSFRPVAQGTRNNVVIPCAVGGNQDIRVYPNQLRDISLLGYQGEVILFIKTGKSSIKKTFYL